MTRAGFFASSILGLMFAFAVAGCSDGAGDSGGVSGSLMLELTIADGVEVDEVEWEIAGGDMDTMSGTINTSAPGSTASIEVFGLPPTDDHLGPVERHAQQAGGQARG